MRWGLAPWRQGDFHTAVLSPSLGGIIRGYGLTFAQPLGPNVLGRGAVLYQVVCYSRPAASQAPCCRHPNRRYPYGRQSALAPQG